MQLVDVNVLIHAHRAELPDHSRYREWLLATMNGDEAYAVAGVVASGFLRIVTNSRIFKPATPLDDAVQAIEDLRARPNCVPLVPGERHWSIFTHMCRSIGAKGNDVPDAYLAALAVEHGCEFVTTDKGFGRFPGLRRSHPLGAAG